MSTAGGIDLRDDSHCICGTENNHVDHWDERLRIHVHSGQCCKCINIRAYYNGASPSYWKGTEAQKEYAEANSDEIHVCDLALFIGLLNRVSDAVMGAS